MVLGNRRARVVLGGLHQPDPCKKENGAKDAVYQEGFNLIGAAAVHEKHGGVNEAGDAENSEDNAESSFNVHGIFGSVVQKGCHC